MLGFTWSVYNAKGYSKYAKSSFERSTQMIKSVVVVFISAVIPLLLVYGAHPVLATSPTDLLLKKILKEQKLQIALQQDNANLAQTKLNLMTFELNNIASYLHILELSQTKSINGTVVNH